MAVPSYFLGSCANTPTPGLSAGQAHAGDFHRVRLFGSWPRKRVHRFDAGSFTAVVLGDCFAAPGESEEILRHGGRPHVVAARMARLAGSHCVIVSRGAEVVVATDLAGLHRVWFRETEGAVEYASTPLALTSASVASVDPEALANPIERDEVAAAFRQEYLELEETHKDPDAVVSRLQWYILGNEAKDLKDQIEANIVLMYFFGECEIFRVPPKDWRVADEFPEGGAA